MIQTLRMAGLHTGFSVWEGEGGTRISGQCSMIQTLRMAGLHTGFSVWEGKLGGELEYQDSVQ